LSLLDRQRQLRPLRLVDQLSQSRLPVPAFPWRREPISSEPL
jgi:hypothetical protein